MLPREAFVSFHYSSFLEKVAVLLVSIMILLWGGGGYYSKEINHTLEDWIKDIAKPLLIHSYSIPISELDLDLGYPKGLPVKYRSLEFVLIPVW